MKEQQHVHHLGASEPDQADETIAVVGMSCRFPSAPSLDAYWDLIRTGARGVETLTAEELRTAGVPDRLISHPDYVPVSGRLEAPTQFDTAGLGLSETEARLMDPQQRILIECSIEALEAAGLAQPGHRGTVGVYAGQAFSHHLIDNLGDRFHPTGGADPINSLHLHGLNVGDYLPARIAWLLGLDGPTVSLGATCATSLVAIHLAAEALLSHQCDTAIAGGVSLRLPQNHGYLCVPDGPFSRDGRTRAYGRDASGTVFTQGAGAVVLRRLSDAIADSDPIHAVVAGSAIGNDGLDRVGFAAPSVSGQARVIAEALAAAEIDPDEVELIEGHGTGTMLGDPIEVRAINEVFGRTDTPWCALGSVKSSIGHTDSAAGVAGFIKAVLAVSHAQIPATLDADEPNPELPLAHSPLTLATQSRPWQSQTRIAGVSAFGIGGINAHVLVRSLQAEAAAAREKPQARPIDPPLLISAADPGALEERTVQVRELTAIESPGDIAGTLAHGLRRLPHRRAIIGGETTEPAHADTAAPSLVAVMPGGGAQHPGMAAGLHRTQPVFARSFDQCADMIAAAGGIDPRGFALDCDARGGEDTRVGLPALAAVELAYLDLLESFGVRPDAVLGHSLGEYSAAVVAGAMDRRDALHLVVERARLFAELPAGAMLSLPLSADDVLALLPDHPDVDLAAVNGPMLSVVSGPNRAIEELSARLSAEGIDSRTLKVSVASHSRVVDPILPQIRALTEDFVRPRPRLPLITGIDGSIVDHPLPAGHWADHLRAPVRFSQALDTAVSGPRRSLLVQTGPGGNLISGAASRSVDCLTAWTAPEDSGSSVRAQRAFDRILAELWSRGVDVDLERLVPRRAAVTVPPYPWQRTAEGIAHRLGPEDTVGSAQHDGDHTSPSADEPLQTPTWSREPATSAPSIEEETRVLVNDSVPEKLRKNLRNFGAVIVDDASRAHMLIHLSEPKDESSLRAEARTFSHYARMLPNSGLKRVVHLTVGAEDVTGGEEINPFATATTGFVRVLGQEVEDLDWVTIDLDPDDPDWAGVAAGLTRFRQSTAASPHRALRHHRTWVRTWRPWQPARAPEAAVEARVWVISGGLGSVGLALAGRIEAENPQARIILISRSRPAPGTDREQALTDLSRTEVLIADVSAPGAYSDCLTTIMEQYGTIDHIVHAPVHVDLAPLAELDDTSINAAFAPKVTGARRLVEAMDSLPCTPTVLLLSSAAGTIGGFGLGAYVAAGRFLDGLAHSTGWTTLDLDRLRLGTAAEQDSAAEISMRHALDLDDAVTTIIRVMRLEAPGMLAASPDELNSRSNNLDTQRTIVEAIDVDSTAHLDGWQKIVADTWSRILSRTVASPEADFFALGGHSLLATRVLAAFRTEHNINLRLKDLLAAPTVAGCAALLETQLPFSSTPTSDRTENDPADALPAVAVAQITSDGADPQHESGFELTRVQYAYWLGRTRGLDPSKPDGEGVGCHFYLEYSCPDIDVDRYDHAWREAIKRHDMLRAVISDDGRHEICDLDPTWTPLHITIDDTRTADAELAQLREKFSTRVADPAVWPLIQPVVVSLPDGSWRILLSVDVLVCDSASWMIVDREVKTLYRDPHAQLGPTPPSFAECLRALKPVDTSERDAARDYWAARIPTLPGAPAITTKTGDTSRPHFTRLSAAVPETTWSQLQELCGRHRVTPTAFVLSLYRRALALWSGAEHFSITMSVFDRPDLPGVDAVVGEFSTMLIHEAAEPTGQDGHDADDLSRHDLWESASRTQDTLIDDLDHRSFSGIEVLTEWSRQRGRSQNVPVVFTSMLGLDQLGGREPHDHEWLGTQVCGVSQTPQVWLDHQAYDHRGELILQWDVCDTVIDLARAREIFTIYTDLFTAASSSEESSPASSDTETTDLTATIVEIWSDLLGVDEDDISEQSFLSLGGDSLLAVRMASALRESTGVSLPLNQVRADLTVDEIATLLTVQDGGEDVSSPSAALERRPDAHAPFRLLPLQQGYFVGQTGGWENSYSTAHVSTDVELTLPTATPDTDELRTRLRNAADAVAAHQPMVCVEVLPNGTQRLREPEDSSGLTHVDVIDLRDDDDPAAALDQLRTQWALNGPNPLSDGAVHVAVVLLGGTRARLHVSSSLLAMDGWSASLYDRELFAQLADPGTAEPPLAIDFGDYVEALEREPSTQREEHRRWWFAQLDELPAAPRLPRSEEKSASAQRMTMREFRLSPDAWRDLRENCRSHELTPATAVLTVFALALNQVTGQQEILLNSMQHNRIPLHADVDRLIGAFSRTALLPLRLKDDETLAELIHTVGRQIDECARRDQITAVDIGREVSRRTGSSSPIAPVVFQSTLGMDSALGGEPVTDLGPFGHVHLADFHQDIRTPQVELELRVFELEGEFIASLASVDEMLAEGVPGQILDHVADAIRTLLEPSSWVEKVRLSSATTLEGSYERAPISASPEVCSSDAVDRRMLPRIAELWATMLDLPVHPGPTDDFFTLGGDSLMAVRMLASVHDRLGTRVSPREFLPEPTPSGLAKAMAQQPPLPTEESIFELRAGTGRPIFLLHPSGGDILCYVELARNLETTRPVIAIADPGLDGHPMPRTIPEMVETYRTMISSIQPDGPWTVGGWSMGGTMAHELACRIRDHGGDVDAVLMLDSNAPERIIALRGLSDADADDVQKLRQLRSIEAYLGLDLGPHTQWESLAASLADHGALPRGEALDNRFAVFARHMEALAGQSARRLDADVPVLLIRAGDESPRNSAEGMGVDDSTDADLGWSPWVAGTFRITDVPAHHYSIVRTPAIQEAASTIAAFLSDVSEVRAGAEAHPADTTMENQ